MRSEVVNRREMLRAWASHDVDVYRAFVETVTTLTSKPLSALRVLDLGCGANAPVTVLLHAAGCKVTGGRCVSRAPVGARLPAEPVLGLSARGGTAEDAAEDGGRTGFRPDVFQ